MTGAVPASERLECHEGLAVEIDDRLVVDADLATVDGPLDRERQLLAVLDTLVHLGLVRDEAALPLALRVVHRDIRIAQEVLGDPDVRPSERDPDAGMDRDVTPIDHERLLDRAHQAVGDELRLLHLGVPEEDGELVAAEPGGKVDRPDAGLDPPGDRDQQLVSDVVAQAVVDGLEVVEVEEEHGGGSVVGVGQRAADALGEEHAVGQTRQRIVERLVAELVLQLGELGQRLLQAVVLDQHARVLRVGLEEPEMLGSEAVGVRAIADQEHAADLGLDPKRGQHHLAQAELSEEMLERWLRRPPLRHEACGPGLRDRPDRAVLGGRERRRSKLVVTRRRHRRDEHRRSVPGEEHEPRDLGSDEPPRRAEQLGHALVEPGRPLRRSHRLVQRLQVLQAHPLGRIGAENHGAGGEGDDQQDRGHVVVAGERDGGERDARARERRPCRDRRGHEHWLVEPIPGAAQVSDGETRSRRNRRSDDRSDPPERTGVILAVDDRVEHDEREARPECERRNPKDDCARAHAAEAHASERDRRTGELRDEELVRREHEETEYDAGLVR